MRRISLVLLFFIAFPALADDGGVSVSMRNMFFGSQRYPQAEPIKVQMQSGQAQQSLDIKANGYLLYTPENPPKVPISDHVVFSFKVKQQTTTIVFNKAGDILKGTYPANCTRLEDAHSIYPFKEFATYIPCSSISFECKVPEGVVQFQLLCRGKKKCWGPRYSPPLD